MRERFEKLQARLGELGLDAYYCRDTSDIRWLTGFEGVFDTEAAHLALVMRAGYPAGCALHTDGRYSEAMRTNPLREELEVSEESVRHTAFAAERIARAFAADGVEVRVGIEESLALNEYRALDAALSTAFSQVAGASYRIVECADPVLALREVKDAGEVALMRRAQQITDATFADLLGWVAPGMTEAHVANEMEYRMRSLGATGLAFQTIVASGPRSAMPHAVPGERALQAGDLVVIDFGAKYGDYCSDMTRTIAIGEPGDELRRIYATVLDAHERAKALVAPGVTGKAVHELAAKVIAEAGYEGRFTHGLGHGVGIDIHESPSLNTRNDAPLVAGNVVTVEPGIYIPGLAGVRIEDYGVVVEGGFDDFTASPHELQVV